MGPAFFIYKVFILIYHLKFYRRKIYRCKISIPNSIAAMLQYKIRNALHV